MDVSAFETGGVLCSCIADDMDRTKGRDTGRSDSCDQHRSSCRISADRAVPSVSYADGLKYINLVEYIKIYPLFTKYHNLDFF